MTIGDPNYRNQLSIMALGSQGSLSLEYLMSLDCNFVMEINETTKQMVNELKNGK